MPDIPDDLEFFATVPISIPRVVPEAEDVDMNGFAWSEDFGLIISIANTGGPVLDELRQLRRQSDDYNTRDNRGLQELED